VTFARDPRRLSKQKKHFEKDIAMPNPESVKTATANEPLFANIEVPTIVTLIVSKQTQYYTLWGGYTAVQFTAGSFGYASDHRLPLGIGLVVLCGVWAFNLGHLGFVLQCINQLNKLSAVLNAALAGKESEYRESLKFALGDMQAGAWFWRFYKRGKHLISYVTNSFVHFLIDVCASAALLIRVDSPWIQEHLPISLKMAC
jgi:hypothetical protein